jgi:ribosomal protein L11 methyltransferase
MQAYLEFTFLVSTQEKQEILLAYLVNYPFEAFQENDNAVLAFVKVSEWNEELSKGLEELLLPMSIDFQSRNVEAQNWNTQWESHFEPVAIEPKICRIYAPFHEVVPGYKNQIIIQPKMAFGTGHHATTRLMIKATQEYNLVDKKILDAGTGTGILAIFAVKRGARLVHATDIDPMAIENAKENEKLNHIQQIQWHTGSLKDFQFPTDEFDMVLANIQLNVLKEEAAEIFRLIRPMGLIFLSGVLNKDQKELLDEYHHHGFELDRIFEENGWICAVMRRFSK